jgi:hypothetical protein
MFLAALVTAASAQTIVINPNKTGVMPPPAAQQVRISLSMSMFVPAASNDSAQALKAQEDGRKMVYDAAGQECDVLRATLASSCTLESININVQYVPGNQNFGQRSEGYNINGNVAYRISTKEPRAETPSQTSP